MTDNALETGITVEWIETDELPFIPEQSTELFLELEPIEIDEVTYYPPDYVDDYKTYYLPPKTSYTKVPDFTAPKNELIVNVETSALVPWEGRAIAIGVLDPNELEPQTIEFIEETEEQTLDAFIEFFENNGYSTIIGYNVAFDYRFLYALMQKYRKTAVKFMDADLYDLMQQQKQVKHEFVYGFNKAGTLDEWALYLFGMEEYASMEQYFRWVKEGNIEEIANYNDDKLVKAYFLYVLHKVVEGTIPGLEIISRQTTPTAETPVGSSLHDSAEGEEMIKVACPQCRQEQSMSKRDKVINCFVCGEPIANPSV